MSRKTVLLVSNRTPRDAGGRAEKVATRSRFLDELGWNVVVGHVPEPYLRGFPRSLWSLVRTGRAEGVDVVLSINNPFHLHIHGALASQMLSVPWVAEFRDPILTRPDLERGSAKWYPAAVAEWLAAHRADRVMWFDGIQMAEDYFESTYPSVDAETFIKLPPIGYEQPKFEQADPESYDALTITYAGSFYEGWIEPYDFIQGFGQFLETSADVRDVRVQFYGDWTDAYDQAASDAGVADSIETYDFIPHEEIVPVLKGSDILVYVGGDDPANRRNLPSKIFDYLGARTPILAVVDPSFRVAEFVRKHDLGIVVSPDDPAAISDALASLASGAFQYDPDPHLFESLTRRRTAERIDTILEEVTDTRAE